MAENDQRYTVLGMNELEAFDHDWETTFSVQCSTQCCATGTCDDSFPDLCQGSLSTDTAENPCKEHWLLAKELNSSWGSIRVA